MTKEQYITIKQALEWVGCLDERFSSEMNNAYRIATETLIELLNEESWSLDQED